MELVYCVTVRIDEEDGFYDSDRQDISSDPAFVAKHIENVLHDAVNQINCEGEVEIIEWDQEEEIPE